MRRGLPSEGCHCIIEITLKVNWQIAAVHPDATGSRDDKWRMEGGCDFLKAHRVFSHLSLLYKTLLIFSFCLFGSGFFWRGGGIGLCNLLTYVFGLPDLMIKAYTYVKPWIWKRAYILPFILYNTYNENNSHFVMCSHHGHCSHKTYCILRNDTIYEAFPIM